jgi:hypothetical protein
MDGRLAGRCFGIEYCRDVVAAGLGDEIGCFYSDWSEFVDGPPPEPECPPAPDELTPFCGGGCATGGCPFHGGTDPEWRVSCVGVNEERGLGICAFGTTIGCGEDTMSNWCELRFGRPCACLRLRLADGELDERGFTTFATSCRAYRERYPGDVECMEPETWVPLP